jgi:hypothetical protein
MRTTRQKPARSGHSLIGHKAVVQGHFWQNNIFYTLVMHQNSNMVRDDIQKIQIDIEADGQSALSLMLCRDGTIGRQGNGSLPPHKISVLGVTDGADFKKLMELVDERIFAHQGIFDHPNKQGLPIKYSVVFIGEEPTLRVFEFRLGLENKDVGDLLPYFDGLIKNAVALTDDWYSKTISEKSVVQPTKCIAPHPKKPWWQLW